LFDRIKNDPKLRNNTLIVICSDNGPEFHCGSAGPFKGLKSTLFEGGVRSPLIVWGPGFTHPEKPGSVNTKSVFSAIDLTPSLLNFAKVSVPEPVQFDGQPLLDTLLGKSVDSHKGALYFRRPPDRKSFRNLKNLPDLAIRYGKWKLLCDYGGGRPMLFDLEADPSEANNLANQHPEIVERLAKAIVQWNMGLPKDAGDPTYNGNKE
jgi:arylsulfatase A-like enzyme